MTHHSENRIATPPAKESVASNRRRWLQFSLNKLMGVTFIVALATKAVLNWQEPERKRKREMWEGMRDEQIRTAERYYEHALRSENPLKELRSLHAIMQGRPSANEVQESPISLDDIQVAPADIQQILEKEQLQLKNGEWNAQPDTRKQITATIRECEDIARLFGLPVNPIPQN